MNLVLILGNQLFEPSHIQRHLPPDAPFTVFMREDRELCTYFKFHKQKIIFFLAAMRTFATELRHESIEVHYEELDPEKSAITYEQSLKLQIRLRKIKKVFLFEIADKFFEKRILGLLADLELPFEIWPSPMFLTPRAEFSDYLKRSKRPFMKTFYEGQRKRLQILVDENLKPEGGQWSYDVENRKALPRSLKPPSPSLSGAATSVQVATVAVMCEREFKSHPGAAGPFWLPVDRAGARRWLKDFISQRLRQFGPYEDAIPAHSTFVFHSVLTPFLNTGLLTPIEVVDLVLEYAEQEKVPLSSLEGFIRQVIGWREFVHGIYQNFSEKQDTTNFWKHRMRLSQIWYGGVTGIPALDRALERVQRHGYLHHIERLMVIGSLMVLLEVAPVEAHRWFMEMFIDSSDWVMGPNVYGMAIFSDGGIFATKPYICGSNYYRKMSGDPKGDWCDGVDGLYWAFIEKHQDFFLKNPRLSMMARAVEKIKPERRRALKEAAAELKLRLVVAP